MSIAMDSLFNNKLTPEPLNNPYKEACTKFVYIKALYYTGPNLHIPNWKIPSPLQFRLTTHPRLL